MNPDYLPLTGTIQERIQLAELAWCIVVYSGESLKGSTIATLRAMQIGG